MAAVARYKTFNNDKSYTTNDHDNGQKRCALNELTNFRIYNKTWKNNNNNNNHDNRGQLYKLKKLCASGYMLSTTLYKITEILRTLWLVNRVAKLMFYCTGKPRFPIYGSSTRELEDSEL